jgi:hypothetical protein
MPTRFPPDPAIVRDAVVSVAVAIAIVGVIETLIWAFS